MNSDIKGNEQSVENLRIYLYFLKREYSLRGTLLGFSAEVFIVYALDSFVSNINDSFRKNCLIINDY